MREMTRYERTFDTDWERLDPDEAVERAYTIGVAERLGEDNREHLERIYGEMETVYERSMVELAFDQGRQEAAVAATESDSVAEIWTDLVEDGPADTVPERPPTGGRDGLPEALGPAEVLDRIDVDSTGATERPGFLDR